MTVWQPIATARDMVGELWAKVASEKEVMAGQLEATEAALTDLIAHTHNCEKELTEDLHHQDFCGESLPLTNARAALATRHTK